ncbi:C45 family peptidase [uncultured Pontibacter sp.]|uniref:C45 family autoproteolytic acyltransferase/hydolase n=1 Tax=uncultured Pontibacter sp. TaxID=453356 RepID=UPI00260B3EF6|nr:C45 family peptidase [uncultured Pontibacter sp.]
MKKTLLLLLLVCLLVHPSMAIPRQPAQVPVLTLSGSGYERGLQHGHQLKKQIAEVYRKWKESIHKDTGKDPDTVIADFLSTSNYQQAIQQWTPDLWQEVQGMAVGSGQKIDDVLAFQLIDEYWGYLDRLENGSVDKDHCSAVGVAATASHPTFIAQNIDIDTYMHGYQVLLHFASMETGVEQYIMTCAGFIGFAGMNNNGVAVVINALTDLNNSTDGLPVTFVTRGILQQQSAQQALDFIKRVPHATGQNYLIGTETEVVNFEASANQVVPFYPVETKSLVYHTNHSLANHDVKPWMQEYHQRMQAGTSPKTNSQTRYETLARRLGASSTELTSELVKGTLRSKDHERFPVCVSYDPKAVAFTFSSVLFTLGRNPSVEVTYGAPDQASYKAHSFYLMPIP